MTNWQLCLADEAKQQENAGKVASGDFWEDGGENIGETFPLHRNCTVGGAVIEGLDSVEYSVQYSAVEYCVQCSAV